MLLTPENKKTLDRAVALHGVTGLCRQLGLQPAAYYSALRRGRGFSPQRWRLIVELSQTDNQQTAASAPNVAIAPVQPSIPSDTAEIDRLLAIELHKLSIEDKRKVYRYVVELQIKRQAEEP